MASDASGQVRNQEDHPDTLTILVPSLDQGFGSDIDTRGVFSQSTIPVNRDSAEWQTVGSLAWSNLHANPVL